MLTIMDVSSVEITPNASRVKPTLPSWHTFKVWGEGIHKHGPELKFHLTDKQFGLFLEDLVEEYQREIEAIIRRREGDRQAAELEAAEEAKANRG